MIAEKNKVLLERIKLIEKASKDKGFRKVFKAKCARDVVFFCNSICCTYDPRKKPAMLPFILFPKQEEYLRWRNERRARKEHGLVEKSRDMGLSYLNVLSQTHSWLFEQGYSGLMTSRKEMLVDRRGDPSSIFEKIRIILRYLPQWMLPEGFNWDVHDNYMRLINPENGSVITGESGSQAGRGARSSVCDWDEVAFAERPEMIDAALSQNSDVIIYTSTPNGIGNLFYRKRFSNKIPVFTVSWRDHPEKDEEWYKRQQNNLDPIILAQEVDLDYTASSEGIYIPAKWVQAAIAQGTVDNPLPMIPPIGENVAALDVASAGQNRTVFGARKGNVVYFIKDWHGLNTTQSAYEVRDLMIEKGCTHLTYDSDGIGGELANSWVGEDLEFTLYPFHGNGTPTERVWEGEDKTSKQKFRNARAEAWGCLRDRFKKTYENFHGIKTHPIEELISIPNHPTLIAQLSVPKYKRDAQGRYLIESKEDMRKRGVESPDFADFAALLFAPVENAVEEFEAWFS